MADSKITALTSISTSTDPANDPLVIVDVSDTSMAATGTTKKVTLNQLLGASGTATLASATITGNLTVNGNGPHRFGTSNYSQFDQSSLQFVGSRSTPGTLSIYGNTNRLIFQADTGGYLFQNAANTLTLLSITNDATQVTLNSTGLGLGVSPVTALSFPIGTNKVVGQSATSSHAAGNVGSLKFGIADGGGDYSGIQIFNTHNGTYSSQDIRFFTGEGGVSVCTERMRITPSGNVGIGVTPSDKLTVLSDNYLSFQTAVTTLNSGRVGRIGSVSVGTGNGSLVFETYKGGSGGGERMRIDSDGNLLVGKTAIGTTVGVEVRPDGYIIATRSASTDAAAFTNAVYSTGASAYRFYVGLGGTVYATNTTISAISDQRLKENVQDIDVGLGAILALKPRKFDWKEGKGKNIKGDRGFIAQEFEQVFPQLVDQWADEAPEGEAPYKSVRQDLIPVLVKAIQELTARVQTLETR